MECVEYEAEEATPRRLRRLEQACRSLLLDSASHHDVRCVGLLVMIGVTAAVRSEETAAGTKRKPELRKRQRLAAYRRASESAATVLKRAHRDAQLLHRRLDRLVPVLVLAVLAPASWRELELFRTWQSQPHAGQLSPLRYAAGVVLRADAEALVLEWPERSLSKRGSSVLRHLSELLLPHQQLILDMTWCVQGAYLARDYTASASHAAHMGKAGLIYRSFMEEVQTQWVAPKGRLAVLLRYGALLRAVDAHATDSDGRDSMWRLTAVQRQLASLQEALYGPTGIGMNCTLYWVISFGGSVASALGRGLPTRQLRDVHALLDLLLGGYTCDTFVEASHFASRLVRRQKRCHRLPDSIRTTVSNQNALVDVAQSGWAVFLARGSRQNTAKEDVLRERKPTIAAKRKRDSEAVGQPLTPPSPRRKQSKKEDSAQSTFRSPEENEPLWTTDLQPS